MKFNQLVFPALIGMFSQSAFGSASIQRSSRLNTLGSGSIAIKNGGGSALLNASNTVGNKDPMIGGEIGYGKFSVYNNKGSEDSDSSDINIQAHGFFPIMKMSGADNPLFVGAVLNSDTVDSELKFKGVSGSFTGKNETTSLAAIAGIGVDMLDFGLKLKLNNHNERNETKFNSLEIKEKEYTTNSVTFSAAAQFTKEIRVAFAFSPEMFKEIDVVNTDSNGNESKSKSLIGESTSMVVGGTLDLKKMLVTAGIERIIPNTFEKNGMKEEDKGLTGISVGGELRIDDLTPRAGLSYGRVTPDYASKRLSFGADWSVTKQVTLLADLAYTRADTPAERKNDETIDRTAEGFDITFGVNAEL